MTHGQVTFQNDHWVIDTAPHVRAKMKRWFAGMKNQHGIMWIKATPDSTEDLAMFLARYEHEVAEPILRVIRFQVEANKANRRECDAIIQGEYEMVQPARMETPLRDYQIQAVQVMGIQDGLLCGDDLGLGKTATAIGAIADGNLPALVVCPVHVQRQWCDQIRKFCPSLRTHIVEKTTYYPMPPHDVTVISYSKLASWADKRKWNFVVYDEVQELRRADSDKYKAAVHLATRTEKRMGLSATPIYNYANETYSVFDALVPGALGTYQEFAAEWAVGDKGAVDDPIALGAWLRGQGIYLRRRRKEVGRELPPLNVMNHTIAHDEKVFERLRGQCNQLAQTVLSKAGWSEKGAAAMALSIKLRQATGLAKAPFVIDFVEELVRNGEQVILAGWHREVYNIWQKEMEAKGMSFGLYTGSESPRAKIENANRFIAGKSDVLVMCLRSGAGLDGLQAASRTVVIGELDWSPMVIHQLIGRLRRDGQESQVTAFYMVSEGGADPLMSQILGNKWEQAMSITDPDLVKSGPRNAVEATESELTQLARAWLQRRL